MILTEGKPLREQKTIKQIMIIGAGASGMTAAIAAASVIRSESEQQNIRITVLESGSSAGNKLLVTGNGRCNLGNRDMRMSYYHADDPVFVTDAFEKRSPADNEAWFKELGLLLWERDGYLYPMSRQASTVRQIFLNEMERLGVRVRYATSIKKIGVCEDGEARYFAETDGGYRYTCDALILANGSCAGKTAGVSDSGYEMAKSMGLEVTERYPSLVQLCTAGAWKNKLSGLRAICTVSVPLCNLHEYGEVQFTDAGISGIPVFQLSGAVNEHLAAHKEVSGEIDFCTTLTEEELTAELYRRMKRNPDAPAGRLLDGLLHDSLKEVLMQEAFIKKEKQPGSGKKKVKEERILKSLSPEEITSLVRKIKHFAITITGSKGFDQAQVVRGGIHTAELDPASMMVKKCPGLFVAGELINVDGRCGGYNLQWAFTSGWLAGEGAAHFMME